MTKHTQSSTPPDAGRLQSVLYCIRDGLRKLVPCHENYGSPTYTKYGMSNSEWDGVCYEEKAQGYLIAHLHAWYEVPSRSWVCCLTIQDGDDFILQRFRPFTWENWCAQMDIYNRLDNFDRNTYLILRAKGFS